MDYDSLALASPSVTRAPSRKFGEENPFGFQTQPQAQTTTVHSQAITSTPVKPLSSQTQTQAPAQAQSQALAQAQPPRLAQAYLLQPQGTVFLFVGRMPSDSLHDEDRLMRILQREKPLK